LDNQRFFAARSGKSITRIALPAIALLAGYAKPVDRPDDTGATQQAASPLCPKDLIERIRARATDTDQAVIVGCRLLLSLRSSQVVDKRIINCQLKKVGCETIPF
jgi:hypothetical protein